MIKIIKLFQIPKPYLGCRHPFLRNPSVLTVSLNSIVIDICGPRNPTNPLYLEGSTSHGPNCEKIDVQWVSYDHYHSFSSIFLCISDRPNRNFEPTKHQSSNFWYSNTVEITNFITQRNCCVQLKNNLGMCIKTFIVILKPNISRNEFIRVVPES